MATGKKNPLPPRGIEAGTHRPESPQDFVPRIGRGKESAKRTIDALFGLGAVISALAVTSLVLLATGTSPVSAFSNIIAGSIGGKTIQDVLVAWVPLALAAAGLLYTFTAGLWNIGIEGQIVLGGIATTWAMRAMQETGWSPWIILVLAILAGAAGGSLWALLAGILKTFGGVNEIFGGLGLNFVATALNLWLIFGPWKRPGIASMSGTLPFPESMWMPTITPQSRLALIPVALAIIAFIITGLLLSGSYFGLRLKAVGKNPRSSYILGIPTWQHMTGAFALCGALAGIAGAMQVTSVYHRLIPSISSGYGYLALMVAMLASCRVIPSMLVAFFFASLAVGSIQLPIVLKLDSSLAGVIQGTLVLAVVLAEGVKRKFLAKKKAGL